MNAISKLEAGAVHALLQESDVDRKASWVAGSVLIALGFLFQQVIGPVLGGLIIACYFIRRVGVQALTRGDLAVGVAWQAAGTWAIAIAVVAVVPEALPLVVLDLIAPLFAAATYLNGHLLRRFSGMAVAIAALLGFLGFMQPGLGLVEDLPVWLFRLVTISYFVTHVALIVGRMYRANDTRQSTMRALASSNTDLREAKADLLKSRRRAIAAADAERVRIERNIHDGAQQQLVTLAVQLHLAAQLADSGRAVSADQLRQLHASAREAIDDVRDLAVGVYPAVLTNRGLGDAVRGLVRRSGRAVLVDIDEGIALGPDDEAAVYFVCAEALQNATKHAGADAEIRVRIQQSPALLRVEVSDTGAGFNLGVTEHSRGLANMSDRVAALGGVLVIDAARGRGTSIRAEIPLDVGSTPARQANENLGVEVAP